MHLVDGETYPRLQLQKFSMQRSTLYIYAIHCFFVDHFQSLQPVYPNAHWVPFIVQNGIWIGSAPMPFMTNLSRISLNLGLASI
jgi:hypothetical protein